METFRETVNLLASTMPFRFVPDALLEEIARLALPVTFEKGQVIYEAGTQADEIFIIAAGQVEHAFDPDYSAESTLAKVVERSAVFGWAALFKEDPHKAARHRLAKATCLENTDVLVIKANDLLGLLNSQPAVKNQVMDRCATMVSREYGFVGFIRLQDRLVSM